MKRATRLGIGLVALIPVMGITGGVLVAIDARAATVAWTSLIVGVVWLIGTVVWALGAPPANPGGGTRHFSGLQGAGYRPPGDDGDRSR